MRGQSSIEPENRPAHTEQNKTPAAGKHLKVLAAGSTAIAIAATGAGLSAQENGGLELTFGLRSELRATDNAELAVTSPGNATFFDTTLSFGLRSVTRRSVLDFDMSGVARLADLPAGSNGDNGFEAPQLRLSYTLDNQNSRLKLKADYQQADLAYLSPLNDDILAIDDAGNLVLVNDTGTRTRYSYGATLETGINAPLGLTLSVTHSGFDYEDTVSTSYYDSDRIRIDGKLRFTLAPDTDAFMRVVHTDFEAENLIQTERQSDNISLGMTHEMDAITTIEASLGYGKTVTDTTAGRSVSDGVIAGASARRTLNDGSIGMNYQREINTNGTRDTLRVSREMDLPRGALSFDLGISKPTSGDAQLVGSVNYRHAMPMGQFSLGFTRSASTNADNEDLIATRLNAGWQHELTEVSSLSLNAGYFQVEDGGAGSYTERDRTNLSIAYNRALTEDWLMSTGFEVRSSQTKGQPEARSNAIFFSLEREFSIRP